MEHYFPSKKITALKRQIGNAVPPIFAKVLFESIKEALNRADGVV